MKRSFDIGYALGLTLGLGLILSIGHTLPFGLAILGAGSGIFGVVLKREGFGISFGDHFEMYKALAKEKGLNVIAWVVIGFVLFLLSYELFSFMVRSV